MPLRENSLWCVEDGVPLAFLRSSWEAKVDRSGETPRRILKKRVT